MNKIKNLMMKSIIYIDLYTYILSFYFEFIFTEALYFIIFVQSNNYFYLRNNF